MPFPHRFIPLDGQRTERSWPVPSCDYASVTAIRRASPNFLVEISECVRRIFEWEILPQVADFSGGEKSSACGRISHVFGVRSAHIFTIEIFS